jgi:hypothetical protein
MQSLILTFRDIERTGALEAHIRDLAERLLRCDERITQCHVTLTGGVGTGGVVAAKFHVSVPGAQIHAGGAHASRVGQHGAHLALRDAYDSARRQIRDLRRDGTQSSLVDAARNSLDR